MNWSYCAVCLCLAVLACCEPCLGATTLFALPEHLRPDPFGGIIAADKTPESNPSPQIVVQAPRASYASCHLVVNLPVANEYRLDIRPPTKGSMEAVLFREWFHLVSEKEQYVPDALIPIALPYQGTLPDRDNRIPRQTAQGFWLDIWVPSDTVPGDYAFTAILRTSRNTSSLTVRVKVLNSLAPAEDAITIDHNSYGTSWFAAQYPALVRRIGPRFFESPDFFALIHAYYRMFYEHRGTFHQLGYGHAGKVGPEFAPALDGWGKNKHVTSWDEYDRHYGPLLDGAAFAKTHRGPKPILFVYLPINPEWPATFESWGEPGYQAEFVHVVTEMEHHFREKGWTHTNFEMFFNQKKRYRGFDWDGDEARFTKDYAYFREYARLLKLAVPADSPVKFVFRADVSWTMERQWRDLAGVVNFWVCGGGMFDWFPYAPGMLKKRGDTVWTYGGTPSITEPSSRITLDLLRAWMQGVQGFVRWETTAPGPDPWFHFGGGRETLVYPGDRFGIPGPIPSIRLKIERNAIQDIDLLDACARRGDANRILREVARIFNQTKPEDWWSPRPALADTDPVEWSNADIDDATQTGPQFSKLLDSAAWQRLRAYAYQLSQETP